MDTYATAAIIFLCLFGAGLLGLRLRVLLPDHHLSTDSKDSVRVGMATVGSMAALVLALILASTKGTYDREKSEVTQMAAKIIYLDRLLANYGPDTQSARAVLAGSVKQSIARMWPDERAGSSQLDPSLSWSEALPNSIHKLAPQDERQRLLKSQALALVNELGQMRWELYEEAESSISTPMLIVMVAWLTMIFLSTGLFAPSNSTVVAAMLLSALSVAGAIFLIMELDLPFDGLVRLSSNPMRHALNHLGK